MTSSRLRAVAALSVLVLAAGCGGDSKSGADSAFAKQSGQKIADAAKTDMEALHQVHFTGSIQDTDSTIKLDIQADDSGDCTGSIGLGDGTAEIRAKDGTNWFKPDAAFWKAQAGDSADAIISAVGDKWVLDTDKNFSEFCDLKSFFDNLFKSDTTSSKYTTDGTSTIGGKSVVKVDQSDTDGTSSGYVLVDGKHYLVKLERTQGDNPGSLEFADFNQSFDVDAPADDDVIDLNSLGGGS